jgi:hypothetical protein
MRQRCRQARFLEQQACMLCAGRSLQALDRNLALQSFVPGFEDFAVAALAEGTQDREMLKTVSRARRARCNICFVHDLERRGSVNISMRINVMSFLTFYANYFIAICARSMGRLRRTTSVAYNVRPLFGTRQGRPGRDAT